MKYVNVSLLPKNVVVPTCGGNKGILVPYVDEACGGSEIADLFCT